MQLFSKNISKSNSVPRSESVQTWPVFFSNIEILLNIFPQASVEWSPGVIEFLNLFFWKVIGGGNRTEDGYLSEQILGSLHCGGVRGDFLSEKARL